MKRLSFIILALLLCATVSFAGDCKGDFCKAPTKLAMMTPMLGAGVSAAAGCTISGCSGAMTCTGSTGCLGRETFEGASDCGDWAAYANCDSTWYYGTDSDPTYATSPIQGAKSVYQTASSGVIFMNYTAQDTVYVAVAIKYSAFPAADNKIIEIGTANMAASHCKLIFYDTNQFVVQNTGGTQQSTSVSMATNTLYYIALKATKGTGANASCTPYISSNGSSWTTGTASTNGTWTAQSTGFNSFGNDSINKWKDDFRWSSSAINYW